MGLKNLMEAAAPLAKQLDEGKISVANGEKSMSLEAAMKKCGAIVVEEAAGDVTIEGDIRMSGDRYARSARYGDAVVLKICWEHPEDAKMDRYKCEKRVASKVKKCLLGLNAEVQNEYTPNGCCTCVYIPMSKIDISFPAMTLKGKKK